MKQLIERILFSIHPTAFIRHLGWYDLWIDRERKSFLIVNKIFYVLCCLSYIAHYITVDKALNLQPNSLWFTYRFSMAGLSILCFGLYFLPALTTSKFLKVPSIIATFLFCFFQARTVLWYHDVPYIYAFVFVFISVLILRMSMLHSILLSMLYLSTIAPTIISSGQPVPIVVSASIVTLIFVIFARANLASEVRSFRDNLDKIETQRKIIELNVQFIEQVKAFLPKEISKRLMQKLSTGNVNLKAAIDTVLKPKMVPIACLFSDIRGFTKRSNDLENFVLKNAVPNIQEFSCIIEDTRGIPRTVGDLIFAYYDHENILVNLMRSLHAGFQLIEVNKNINLKRDEPLKIERHILISTGMAVVGNIGSFDSSREITALGKPVNLLSRIDELTKNQALKSELHETDLILSDEAARLLMSTSYKFEMEKIALIEKNLQIRDFPNETFLWRLPVTESNKEILTSALFAENNLDFTRVNAIQEESAA